MKPGIVQEDDPDRSATPQPVAKWPRLSVRRRQFSSSAVGERRIIGSPADTTDAKHLPCRSRPQFAPWPKDNQIKLIVTAKVGRPGRSGCHLRCGCSKNNLDLFALRAVGDHQDVASTAAAMKDLLEFLSRDAATDIAGDQNCIQQPDCS
ncbi:hypothetical protein XH98_00130 [Bradyrhizobium sp. CCBAU 51745]|nr:hypothetical protein [Bradyrhizobium sp. CCBAU 51745]